MSWTLSRSLGIIAGSMTWRVQLAGDPRALRELAKVMQTPEATIHEEGSAFVLESTHFTSCTESGEVQAQAAKLAEWLSGTAALALGTRTPITAGAIEGPPAPNGGRSIYVTATVAVHVRGTAWATVTRNRPDGTVETIHPADAVRAWLSLAQRRPEVADVLRQWRHRGTRLVHAVSAAGEDRGGCRRRRPDRGARLGVQGQAAALRSHG